MIREKVGSTRKNGKIRRSERERTRAGENDEKGEATQPRARASGKSLRKRKRSPGEEGFKGEERKIREGR